MRYRITEEIFNYTDKTAIYPKDKGLEYCLLGLGGEVGELQNKFKKTIRDNKELDLDSFCDELGDVYWYWVRLCKEADLDPLDVILNNKMKLEDRMMRNVISGSGDKR